LRAFFDSALQVRLGRRLATSVTTISQQQQQQQQKKKATRATHRALAERGNALSELADLRVAVANQPPQAPLVLLQLPNGALGNGKLTLTCGERACEGFEHRELSS
jgi:hypothetical protein